MPSLVPTWNQSFLDKLQVFQIFLLCFSLMILTVELAKAIQQYWHHSPNAGMPWNFFQQISLAPLYSASQKLSGHENK
jgi:hypothetical protein